LRPRGLLPTVEDTSDSDAADGGSLSAAAEFCEPRSSESLESPEVVVVSLLALVAAEAALDSDDVPPDSEESANAAGVHTVTAAPIPNATASAPTRPT
jgi:hypothetical protein